MEGEVIEVKERGTSQFIGNIYLYESNAIVIPEGSADIDIIVNLEDTKGAKQGNVVVVKVTEWIGGRNKVIKGKVIFSANKTEYTLETVLEESFEEAVRIVQKGK